MGFLTTILKLSLYILCLKRRLVFTFLNDHSFDRKNLILSFWRCAASQYFYMKNAHLKYLKLTDFVKILYFSLKNCPF